MNAVFCGLYGIDRFRLIPFIIVSLEAPKSRKKPHRYQDPANKTNEQEQSESEDDQADPDPYFFILLFIQFVTTQFKPDIARPCEDAPGDHADGKWKSKLGNEKYADKAD